MLAHQRLENLLQRIHEGIALPEDYHALRELINADASGDIIARVHAFHEANTNNTVTAQPYDAQYWDSVVKEVLQVDKQAIREAVMPPAINTTPVHRVHFLRRRFGWIAAALLILFAGGAYLLTQREHPSPAPAVAVKETQDIMPGKNGALLTLSNGSTIVLDSLQNGVIAVQGNTAVRLNDGKLEYGKNDQQAAQDMVAYNTLVTPRGSQYQVVLPDGTKAWLNAASSLRFPTAFTGTAREIEITGEAYLEVAKDKTKPFRVHFPSPAGGGREGVVEVLGTHFNINAYDDEAAMKVTLLEGSVKVKSEVRSLPAGQAGPKSDDKSRTSVILKPGEQASIVSSKSNQSTQIVVQTNVNVEEVVAWKNGFFHFDGSPLQVVMRQLSRWYDVDVSYQGMPDQSTTFSGKMGRDLRLAQVLKILQKSEVHFDIQNRKLIVLP